jgi:thiamine pyrophosphokinase
MRPAEAPLRFGAGVVLVGGGELDRAELDAARARCAHVVAADGGANRLRGWGVAADAVIGDMDSVADLAGWERDGARVLRIAEQETTDLEKCLYATEAPFYIGVGFTGLRFDHTLAALHALLRWPAKTIVLLGASDVVLLAPPRWGVTVEPGARVSFFPLRPVRGLRSTGLEWPIDGLDFAAGHRIGTSNRATDARVTADFDGEGMAAILEARFLDAALTSLG